MVRSKLASLLVILTVAAAAFGARADAIGPPPSRCPPGAIPESSHVGEYCYPGTCMSNADCEGREVCVEQPLCVEVMQGSSRGGPMTVDHAVTTCTPEGTCPPSAVCQTELRCVSRASALSGGDGMAVPTAGIAIAIAGLLLLVVVLLGIAGLVFALTRKKKRQERRG